ncbi:hypothetical protein CPC08DRAFT_770783 [Agrocybe pediades]|nr:hypothetical protein CPC08DRAFT_770783 [Agrocybe pediades]
MRLEVHDLCMAWTDGIDRKLARLDSCWDMDHGWKGKTHFKGSNMEKSLHKRLMQVPKVIDGLKKVLKILPADHLDWPWTIDKLEEISGKAEVIRRIFLLFYGTIPRLEDYIE